MEDKLFSLWPVNILHRVYSNHEQDKNNLLKFIQDYKKENPEGRSGSENSSLYESKYDLIKYIENNETLKKNFITTIQQMKEKYSDNDAVQMLVMEEDNSSSNGGRAIKKRKISSE